jgi:drug/metabolite transporter (DMT)-like permease
LTVVTMSRAFRYTIVALIAHLYGRHVIRVLRHPTQYWGWFSLFAGIFVGVIATGMFLHRRVAEPHAA